MNRILIVKTSAIGDVIQTFPLLDYLRKKFPDAQIDWVVEAAIVPLLHAHPDVNRVIEIETKQWRKHPLSLSTWRAIKHAIAELRLVPYDLVIDVQGNTKSAFVTGLARSRVKLGFDRAGVREKLNLLVTNRKKVLSVDLSTRDRYVQLAQRFFQDESPFLASAVELKLTPKEQELLATLLQEPIFTKKPCIMICFGAKWKNKRLPEETWVTLLEKMKEILSPSYLFIFGNREEEAMATRLQSTFASCSQSVGRLSLPLWQALMRRVDLVVAMDSAALHLCGTTQTASFSLFGPTRAAVYKPSGEKHRFFQGTCPYGRTFFARCPILRTCPTGACLRGQVAENLFPYFLSAIKAQLVDK